MLLLLRICIKVRYNLTSTFFIDSKTHHFLVKVFMIRLHYLKTESIQTLNINTKIQLIFKPSREFETYL